MNQEEIIKLAAEAGAKAAMETLDRERQRDRQEMADRRLWNTKLLLKNYRSFVAHVAKAVFTVDDYVPLEEIWTDLMMPGRDSTWFVESIKQSVARTATIVKHMEAMMDLYKVYCTTIGTAEDERRWRIINGLYISDERKSVKELAQAEGVVERTIYKDIDIACERIAALMFGVDGLKRR